MRGRAQKRFFNGEFAQKTFFGAKNVFGGTDSFQPETKLLGTMAGSFFD